MVCTVARSALVAASLAFLGACAPITVAPVGLNLGGGLGSAWSSFSQCSMLGGASPEAARMGVRTPNIQANAVRGRGYQLQSHFVLGYSAPSTTNWKRIASGDC